MASFLYILVPFAILAVAIVLGMGLHNMMKGGDSWRSQRLMQWRVILQAVAIVIIMAAIYFAHR
jgi:Hypoxia induced protein conserved region